jgi:hypothetical protein
VDLRGGYKGEGNRRVQGSDEQELLPAGPQLWHATEDRGAKDEGRGRDPHPKLHQREGTKGRDGDPDKQERSPPQRTEQ